MCQIDAFSSKLFAGNPAAVCLSDKWLPDKIMQSIAAENNLSETAFFISKGNGFHIRWFTPVCEFDSKSVILAVTKDGGWLTMDFSAQFPLPCDIPVEIVQVFNITPIECLESEGFIVVFEREIDIELADLDFELLKKLDLRGVIITAKSSRYDFVARSFASKYGIPEDPVTGSAYTQLAPYWASKIGLKRFRVKQMSSRGGDLTCEVDDDRVFISGKAIKHWKAELKSKRNKSVKGDVKKTAAPDAGAL